MIFIPSYLSTPKRMREHVFRIAQTLKQDKTQWGPRVWYYVHSTAAYYVEQNIINFGSITNQWLTEIEWLLPCSECKQHYIDALALQNREDLSQNPTLLFLFFFNFHNEINQLLQKPQKTFLEASDLFFNKPYQYVLPAFWDKYHVPT